MTITETLAGPPLPKIRYGALVFDRQGPNAAKEDCIAFLESRGFTIGKWQPNVPCVAMFGEREMPRWSQIAPADRMSLHGLIMGDSYRGPLVFKLTSSAPAAARVAIATQ